MYFMKYIRQSTFFLCTKGFLESFSVFQPSQPLKLIWDCIQLITIFCFFFFIPIKVIYNINLIDLMGTHIFFIGVAILGIDILVSANSGFYLKGFYKSERWEVLNYYLKTSFLYDFGVLLLLLIESHIWNFVLLLFFYKLKPYSLIIKRIEESFYFNINIIHYMRLGKLLAFILFVAHIFSCFWVIIGMME